MKRNLLTGGILLFMVAALSSGCGGGSSSGGGPLTFSADSAPQTHIITINGTEVEADEIEIGLKGNGSFAAEQPTVTALVNKYHLGRVVYYIDFGPSLTRSYTLTTSDSQDLPNLIQSLQSEPTVGYAEYNYIAHAASSQGKQ